MSACPRRQSANSQRGTALIVGLIMLVLLFLLGIAAFNMTRQNAAITGNVQARQQAINAAMQATDVVISNTQFMNTPSAALTGSCGGNKYCVDINDDGVPDVTVTLIPQPCVKEVAVIQNSSLNLMDPQDLACTDQSGPNLGIAGSTNNNSLCANSVWEINAVATDDVTQTSATVTTGVAVRVATDDATSATNACP